MRVCIVEDNDHDAKFLQDGLEQFFAEAGIPLELARLHDGLDVIKGQWEGSDILFLDIEMEGLDGLSTARAIRERHNDVIIFFVTHSVQYALEGYTVDASGYLVKPIKYSQLKNHMKRALATLEQRKTRLVQLRTGREYTFVNSNHIMYVETAHKHSLIHTDVGEIPCSESLQSVEKRLDPAQFFRVHASFLVNLAFVDLVTPRDVIVQGTALPVSKHRKKFFMKALTAYKGRTL